MFTEDDLLNYLGQIQEIEKKMQDTYEDLHHRLTHPAYKEIFAQMAKEEKAHYAMIENLKHLLAE